MHIFFFQKISFITLLYSERTDKSKAIQPLANLAQTQNIQSVEFNVMRTCKLLHNGSEAFINKAKNNDIQFGY